MEWPRFRLRVTFQKKGIMCYFSQLDLLKILERAGRRANLPFYFTQGFSPRPKFSFNHALKLGVEGEIEVIFHFTERMDKETLKKKLIIQLPEGLDILRVEEVCQ